jgi:hypothetical protein
MERMPVFKMKSFDTGVPCLSVPCLQDEDQNFRANSYPPTDSSVVITLKLESHFSNSFSSLALMLFCRCMRVSIWPRKGFITLWKIPNTE